MDNSLYIQYGKLIRSARNLFASCSTKGERKILNATLRDCGIDDTTLNKMLSGTYVEEEDVTKLYLAVLCFYLNTIMVQKKVEEKKWNYKEMTYDKARSIVDKENGTIKEYAQLIMLLHYYGRPRFERTYYDIKVLDPSLLGKQRGIQIVGEAEQKKKYTDGELVIVNGRRLRRVQKDNPRVKLNPYAQLIVDNSDIIGSRLNTFLNKVGISEEKYHRIESGEYDDLPTMKRILGIMVKYALSKYSINPSSVPVYFPDKKIIDLLAEGKGEAQLYASFFNALENYKEEKHERTGKTRSSQSQNTRKEWGSAYKPVRIGRN